MIKELEEFRANRKVYELTPRKFNKVKGVRKEDLYPVDDSAGEASSGIDTDDETFLELQKVAQNREMGPEIKELSYDIIKAMYEARLAFDHLENKKDSDDEDRERVMPITIDNHKHQKKRMF